VSQRKTDQCLRLVVVCGPPSTQTHTQRERERDRQRGVFNKVLAIINQSVSGRLHVAACCSHSLPLLIAADTMSHHTAAAAAAAAAHKLLTIGNVPRCLKNSCASGFRPSPVKKTCVPKFLLDLRKYF